MSEEEIKDPVLYALNLKAIKLEMENLKLKKKFTDYKKAVKRQVLYFTNVMENHEEWETGEVKEQIKCYLAELYK